ncbi:hypothetical protein V1477_002638 [Vespula maculifrons]|uniref:Uncharacterized protein n=1 Tax=Vespula maculifrons TaxID=7453 RepID=A0ABD2CXZ6_VESMC
MRSTSSCVSRTPITSENGYHAHLFGASTGATREMHVFERLHRTELRKRIHSLRSIAVSKRRLVSVDRRTRIPVLVSRR